MVVALGDTALDPGMKELVIWFSLGATKILLALTSSSCTSTLQILNLTKNPSVPKKEYFEGLYLCLVKI